MVKATCNICREKAKEFGPIPLGPYTAIAELLHKDGFCEVSDGMQEKIRDILSEFKNGSLIAFSFEKDITHYEHGEKEYWSIYEDMIETCPDVFGDCPTNHEVDEKLCKANVVLPKNRNDSESGGFCVYFDEKPAAKSFINRLNNYLDKKRKALEEAAAL